MSDFLRLIWDICCLRRGPQDLPYAPLMLGVLCGAELALHAAESWLLPVKQEATFASSVFLLAFNLAALYALLKVSAKDNRFVQAALALLGTSLVFQLMFVPIVVAFGEGLAEGQAHPTPIQTVAGLASLGVLLWDLMVDAHILRHSLDVRIALGVLIAIVWRLAEFALNAAVVGGPGAATA